MLVRSFGIALGVASCVSAASQAPLSRLLQSLRCPAAVERQLELWSVSGEILRAPSGVDGRETFRLATSSIGVWVTLQKTPSPSGDDAVLVLTTRRRASRIETDEDCRPEVTKLVLDRPPMGSNGFSDEDLERELARDGRLVVYLWSPHMPLSVEGYAEIVAATRALGLPLVAMVDPSSDPAYVEKASKEWGIPEDAARPLASVELLMRDLAVHSPTILVFSGGRAEAPLPGYRGRVAYEKYLRSIFGPAR